MWKLKKRNMFCKFWHSIAKIILFFYLMQGSSFAETKIEKNQNATFLSLTDIHFDPFISCHHVTPCPLIQKLRDSQASEWSSILFQYDKEKPQYKLDSNYSLFLAALNSAKKIAVDTNAQFVVVLGDFLGHNFRQSYVKYTHDRSREGYRAFVRKTFIFIMSEFAKAFSSIEVYPVVGNNDSYQADYYSYPHGEFFQDAGMLWSKLIQNKNNQVAMQKKFIVAGYYSIDLSKINNLRLIALNTNLFAYKAKGRNIHQAANEELIWLHNELKAAREKKQKVIILMHIPPGIDVYASLRFRLFTLIELWYSKYTLRFQAELRQFAPEIVGLFAGHLHFDWFQTMTFNSGDIPFIGTPAISPIFGNNPTFKVFYYKPNFQQFNNSATYYFPLKCSPKGDANKFSLFTFSVRGCFK
jgi:sphingomyelin phosphodiesterase acid-like 3